MHPWIIIYYLFKIWSVSIKQIDHNPLKMDYKPNIFHANLIHYKEIKSVVLDFFDRLIMKYTTFSKLSRLLFSDVATYYVL